MALKNIPVTVLLEEKGSVVFSIPLHSTVEAAVSEMNRQRIGSVVVMDESEVAGVFTERDVLTRVVAANRDARSTQLSEVMTRDIKRIESDTSIEDAMHLMTQARVRHLPVFKDGQLLGLVSIGDITRWLLKVNQMEAENLRKYVASVYPG